MEWTIVHIYIGLQKKTSNSFQENLLRVKKNMYVPLAFHRAGSNPRLRTQGAVEGAPSHDSSHFVCVKLRAKTGEFFFKKKFQIFDFLQRKADSVVIVLGRIIRQLRQWITSIREVLWFWVVFYFAATSSNRRNGNGSNFRWKEVVPHQSCHFNILHWYSASRHSTFWTFYFFGAEFCFTSWHISKQCNVNFWQINFSAFFFAKLLIFCEIC